MGCDGEEIGRRGGVERRRTRVKWDLDPVQLLLLLKISSHYISTILPAFYG